MRLRAFTVLTILVLACGAAGSAHETGLETETEVTGDAKIRVFEGVAAPNPADAGGFDLYGAFPNDHNPFRIDTTIALGMDGFGLRGPDRGLLGELPGAGPDWALNMIPPVHGTAGGLPTRKTRLIGHAPAGSTRLTTRASAQLSACLTRCAAMFSPAACSTITDVRPA